MLKFQSLFGEKELKNSTYFSISGNVVTVLAPLTCFTKLKTCTTNSETVKDRRTMLLQELAHFHSAAAHFYNSCDLPYNLRAPAHSRFHLFRSEDDVRDHRRAQTRAESLIVKIGDCVSGMVNWNCNGALLIGFVRGVWC